MTMERTSRAQSEGWVAHLTQPPSTSKHGRPKLNLVYRTRDYEQYLADTPSRSFHLLPLLPNLSRRWLVDCLFAIAVHSLSVMVTSATITLLLTTNIRS